MLLEVFEAEAPRPYPHLLCANEPVNEWLKLPFVVLQRPHGTVPISRLRLDANACDIGNRCEPRGWVGDCPDDLYQGFEILALRYD